MRFVALVSGGKDSIYSILEAIKQGHDFVACIHMGRPENEEEESYMYQTAGSEIVKTLVEECLQVPLLLHQRTGKSKQTSLIYNHDQNDNDENAKDNQRDEIEDLYDAIQIAKSEYDVDAVCSGAILSTYQRLRIENVCSRLGMTSLSFLWRMLPQKQLLPKMIEDGINAIVVRTACPPGLLPRKHLNKTLGHLWYTGIFEKLHNQYQFHICGEGGEYESFVLDSPIHKRKLVLDEVEILEDDMDGTGTLKIHKCHAEIKTEDDIPILTIAEVSVDSTSPPPVKKANTTTEEIENKPAIEISSVSTTILPHVNIRNGGLLHINELYSSVKAASDEDRTEAELAVIEAKEIFDILYKTLTLYDAKPTDAIFVHLYLSEISHFSNINTHYQTFFGSLLPPSRSCVAVGPNVLPGGRRVLLDCMVQLGSGEYMRTNDSSPNINNEYAIAAHATKTSKLRDVLHVQSLSHWAPVCVGPYSQVNTLRSCLHFCAGQIGLVPATMKLQPTWALQLEQCWKNVASVLDALEAGSLDHLFSSLIYVSHDVFVEKGSMKRIESITSELIQTNGNIIPGQIEPPPGKSADELYGGYEDEGTWLEEMKNRGVEADDSDTVKPCPMLVIAIPEMPKGAIVEVEVVAVTEKVASNLEMKDASFERTICCINQQQNINPAPLGWSTGHTFQGMQPAPNEQIKLFSCVRNVGHRCAANTLVVATTKASNNIKTIGIDGVLQDMFDSVHKVFAEGRSGLNPADTIHVRLYYIGATLTKADKGAVAINDGSQMRSSLGSAIGKWVSSSKTTISLPSASAIPVAGFSLINSTCDMENEIPLLALHVMAADPVHFETERWINSDREYNT